MALKTTFYAFGNGLREGDDPKMQEPGTPRRIRNLRPVKGGRLAVRRDFAAVAMTSNQSFDLVAQDLCKLNGRLFAIGGRIPVNPSGGLASFGEAIPAQAIAQVCELTWQLRGQAGDRQVEGATVGLSINQGLFGHGSSVILTK